MPGLRTRINEALSEAMRSGDELRIGTLRLMLAALKDREAALRAEDGPDELGPQECIELLQRMIRQREASIRSFEQAARMELAEQERREIAIIQEFLPRPLSEGEADQAVDRAIWATGARSVRDIGKVMAHLKSNYRGRMNFANASAKVKAALGC